MIVLSMSCWLDDNIRGRDCHGWLVLFHVHNCKLLAVQRFFKVLYSLCFVLAATVWKQINVHIIGDDDVSVI